jgi:hypothetical protein
MAGQTGTLTPSRRPALVVAGVATIILPIVGVLVKSPSNGWLAALAWPVVGLLLPVYAMQIVIASTGLVTRRVAMPARGIVAAWLTSLAWVLAMFFLPDFNDTTFGSTFMYVLGLTGNERANDLSRTLSLVFVGLSGLSGFWLFSEWAYAIAARSHRADGPGR